MEDVLPLSTINFRENKGQTENSLMGLKLCRIIYKTKGTTIRGTTMKSNPPEDRLKVKS